MIDKEYVFDLTKLQQDLQQDDGSATIWSLLFSHYLPEVFLLLIPIKNPAKEVNIFFPHSNFLN